MHGPSLISWAPRPRLATPPPSLPELPRHRRRRATRCSDLPRSPTKETLKRRGPRKRARLEQEREARNRRIQGAEHRMGWRPQRTRDTNGEARGLRQSIEKIQNDISTTEATRKAR
eukprot:1148858-Pyramimonas_sp.AAC.1